jgi:hypothetical protein
LRKGDNRIQIRVTNTLLAHVQGLTEMPPVPDALQPRLGTTLPPDERLRAAWERDRSFQPLPLSGMPGPVRLRFYAK